MGHLGGSVDQASPFGSSHDSGVLGWSLVLGSLLSRKSASPSRSPSAPAPVLSLALTLSQTNKIFKVKNKKSFTVQYLRYTKKYITLNQTISCAHHPA